MLETITFGPLGVLPAFRNRGVARALIKHSLAAARDMGRHPACVIYGDPSFYGRLGFRCAEKWDITNQVPLRLTYRPTCLPSVRAQLLTITLVSLCPVSLHRM